MLSGLKCDENHLEGNAEYIRMSRVYLARAKPLEPGWLSLARVLLRSEQFGSARLENV